jgi:hypothetical protein
VKPNEDVKKLDVSCHGEFKLKIDLAKRNALNDRGIGKESWTFKKRLCAVVGRHLLQPRKSAHMPIADFLNREKDLVA